MKKVFKLIAGSILATTLALSMLVIPTSAQQVGNSVFGASRQGGLYNAAAYGRWSAHVFLTIPVGATSVTLDNAYFPVSPTEGRSLSPFGFSSSLFPSIVVGFGATRETLTVSGASGCNFNASISSGSLGSCVLTVSATANAHGAGEFVGSGTFGLQEAMLDANASGGGTVVVDSSWTLLGGATANITAQTLATPTVWISDQRGPAPRLFGKSGTGAAAYSDTNNDISFTLASAGTKTLSQTYAAAPNCVASQQSGTAAALTVNPTVSTVVLAGTGPFAVHCDY